MKKSNLVALMEWQLGQEDLAQIASDAEQAASVGDYSHPAFKKMAQAPKLDAYESVFWEAYQELGSCRYPGFGGLTQIPFTAILIYAEFWGYTRSETEDLLKAVRQLEAVHLPFVNSQNDQNP